MVKLAYIMSRFPKITETFILYEILELERLGLYVEVYPLLRENQPVKHPEAEGLVKRAHYEPFLSKLILKANWYFIRHRPIVYFKMVADVLLSTFGSYNFFIGALSFLPKSVLFAYKMQKQGITHIHAHFSNHATVSAFIINRLTDISFSFTAHAFDIFVEHRMLDKKVKAALFSVTISTYNKDFMVRLCGKWAREKIHVIHCGIDPEIFCPVIDKETKEIFTMICVASLEEKKGHEYLIKACRILKERGVDFICHLVGDGSFVTQIEEQILKANLKDGIILHKSLNRATVAKMMQSANVKILPSVRAKDGDQEGIPVVLMEAMAVALPVISTKLSGIPELVETGQTGILVPPRDSDALADAIQRLQSDPLLCREMGLSGKEKVLKDFNLQTNTAKLYDLFCSKVSNNANRYIEQ